MNEYNWFEMSATFNAEECAAQNEKIDAALENLAARALLDKLTKDNWLFLVDYHADFYEIARDPTVYAHLLEATVFAKAERGFGALGNGTPITFFANRVADETADDDGARLTNASVIVGKDLARKKLQNVQYREIPERDGAPACRIQTDAAAGERILCGAQTDRIFGRTLKDCARALAEAAGLEIPAENVVVLGTNPDPTVDALQTGRVDRSIIANFIHYNPDLAIAWGLATEELRERLAREVEKERQERAAQAPPSFSQELLAQLEGNYSPEVFAEIRARFGQNPRSASDEEKEILRAWSRDRAKEEIERTNRKNESSTKNF